MASALASIVRRASVTFAGAASGPGASPGASTESVPSPKTLAVDEDRSPSDLAYDTETESFSMSAGAALSASRDTLEAVGEDGSPPPPPRTPVAASRGAPPPPPQDPESLDPESLAAENRRLQALLAEAVEERDRAEEHKLLLAAELKKQQVTIERLEKMKECYDQARLQLQNSVDNFSLIESKYVELKLQLAKTMADLDSSQMENQFLQEQLNSTMATGTRPRATRFDGGNPRRRAGASPSPMRVAASSFFSTVLAGEPTPPRSMEPIPLPRGRSGTAGSASGSTDRGSYENVRARNARSPSPPWLAIKAPDRVVQYDSDRERLSLGSDYSSAADRVTIGAGERPSFLDRPLERRNSGSSLRSAGSFSASSDRPPRSRSKNRRKKNRKKQRARHASAEPRSDSTDDPHLNTSRLSELTRAQTVSRRESAHQNIANMLAVDL